MSLANEELRLKKAHIALMKHPETALYSGVMLMGSSSVESGKFTAYTDGINKKYCADFIRGLDDKTLRGLILHETLHVALKHIIRFRKEFKAEPQLINAAADFVVNDIIFTMNDNSFVGLPDGALYDQMFHGWSVREVYDYLKKHSKKQKQPKYPNGEEGGDGSDDGSGSGETIYKPLDEQIGRAHV